MPYRRIKTMDGRRGAFLMLAGIMFLPFSISYLFTIGRAEQVESFAWLPDVIRLWQFGILFTVAGLTAAIIGLFSNKLSPKLVSYGFVATMIPPLVATGLDLIALILGVIPITSALDIIFYLSLIEMIYLVSAWPNPLPRAADPPLTGKIPTVRGGDNGTLA